MTSEKIVYRSIKSKNVDTRVTNNLERTGYLAWKNAFTNRTEDEIRRQYDPTAEDIDRRQREYRKFARRGALVVAFAGIEPVGFVAADNEVSRNDSLIVKVAKRLAFW